MGDINQDDIDKLLAGALSDGAAPAEQENAAGPSAGEQADGPVGQDDIDAMFASLGDAPAVPAPEPESATTAQEAAPGHDDGGAGIANQDDIDALFSTICGDDDSPAPKPEPPSEPTPEPMAEAAAPVPDAPEAPEFSDADDAMGDHSDLTALLDSLDADAEKEINRGTAAQDAPDTEGLNGLLSAIAGNASPPTPSSASAPQGTASDTVRVDTVDMDELLRQISSAAPPEAELPSAKNPAQNASPGLSAERFDSTVVLPQPAFPDAHAGGQPPAVEPTAVPAAPASPAPSAMAALPSFVPPASPGPAPESLSVMASAGEVESMAGQISGMLGQLSEKTQRYMQAWITADAEAKGLRGRLLAEERLRAAVGGEKDALQAEVEQLRGNLAKLEGEKLGLEEARRNAEASLHARIRELESRASMLDSEVESLKDELTRTRTQATGVDIESRRSRFEAERLKNEVESERMERLRMQRALENREKELQAVQAQASGQASSLFIDELHRLVRRLESELDSRTSGAHEALKQLDRLDVSENMVPAVANLRAALMRAVGADADDADDAIKSLGREAARVQGPNALEPGKTEMLSFETALSTYNLGAALDVAGALLREFKATPGALMRRVYQCPALRRPEVSEHLVDLARLLEGLRTVQESADRTRGRESAESEVFYVQMFDFLHNLVRLKIVTRLTGDPWRLFLDLRGRFSFVTSDKQWSEYRDGVLNADKTRTA
ncbi:MAG: hypothetical protein LBJ46_00465 [Planctomycetota bacterium]|jgi:hypothetical protein|nr:hypothetical protein [Planctomycetota bacterium]